MHKLRIIYYHEVVKAGEGFSYQRIEIEKFRKQMKYLKENGYQSLRFSELSHGLPEKAIIVSFDDGFRTVYENAMPIMEEYDIKGNIYLPTYYIGREGAFLSWEQAEEMSGRFYFAAHTHTHADIRTLTRETAREEADLSAEQIRAHFGYMPEAFCMPYGTFDRRSVRLIRETGGYRYILGSFYGAADEKSLETKVLPRIGIKNDDSMKTFADKLAGRLDWKGPLQRARLMLQNLRGERIDHYEY